jgi:hypothetical protein
VRDVVAPAGLGEGGSERPDARRGVERRRESAAPWFEIRVAQPHEPRIGRWQVRDLLENRKVTTSDANG